MDKNSFETREDGIYYVKGKSKAIWLCSPLESVEHTKATANKYWAVSLTWYDRSNVLRSWEVQTKALSKKYFIDPLVAMGLRVNPMPKAIKLLGFYLLTYNA